MVTYRLKTIPSADRYAEALSVRPPTALRLRILFLLRECPECRASVGTIGAKLTVSGDYRTVNAQLGAAGRKVGEYLGIDFPIRERGKKFVSLALAQGEEAETWYWKLYPEVAEAIDLVFPDWRERLLNR